jgi:hypothetical protein
MRYINSYNKAHILLDQACYDQGYNALEAMAKGKVVLGAEQQFIDHYKLSAKVVINASLM